MPAWGNTDSVNDKPHMPLLRQVRDVVTTTVANTGTAAGVLGGNTVIRVSTVTGIAVGQFVYDSGVGIAVSGESAYFKGNNTVLAITSGGTETLNVVLTNALLFLTVPCFISVIQFLTLKLLVQPILQLMCFLTQF